MRAILMSLYCGLLLACERPTEQINTSTVFVHVSDSAIGTGQTENISRRKSIDRLLGFYPSFYSYKFQDDHSETVEKLVIGIQ